MHIKGLNWGYKADLMKLKIKYFNKYAAFEDAHTIKLTDPVKGGDPVMVTADKIVIHRWKAILSWNPRRQRIWYYQ